MPRWSVWPRGLTNVTRAARPCFGGVERIVPLYERLVRKTTFDSRLAFVKISSYEGTESTGEVKQQFGVDSISRGAT